MLTQFNSHTLNTHIAASYPPVVFGGPQKRGFVDVLTASQTPKSANWYKGSADAVRQQLDSILDAFRGMDLPDELLILSGQALYRMVSCAVPCCAIPCCLMLCCAMLCKVMLNCAMPCLLWYPMGHAANYDHYCYNWQLWCMLPAGLCRPAADSPQQQRRHHHCHTCCGLGPGQLQGLL